ncbi:MAG: alpha/beta fold hydrolase [Steroidobacteraceae bacterium]
MPTVTANGHAVRYEIEGPADAPVLAFANSLGTTLEMWDAQIPDFRDHYRCLRFDTRGHGASAVVAGSATVDDLADDFAGLLEVIGIDRVHLVGLSLGGMMGQAFAVRYARRLRSLTLVSTTAHAPPPEAWATRAEIVRREGMGAIADAVMQRWFTPAYREAGGPAVRENEQRFRETSPMGYAHCCGIIERLDQREANRGIRKPTLIVVGALDPATPPTMAEDMRSRITDSELLVLSKSAHLLAVERPRTFNSYLDAYIRTVA